MPGAFVDFPHTPPRVSRSHTRSKEHTVTKHPVANLALSCLVSWSMILSGFMPAAQALADEAQQVPAYEVSATPAAQEETDQEGSSASDSAEPTPDASSGDASEGDAAEGAGAEPQPDPSGEQEGEQTPADQPEAQPTPEPSESAPSDDSALPDDAASEAPLAPEETLSLVYVSQVSLEEGQTQQVALMLADEASQVVSAQLILSSPYGDVEVEASAIDMEAVLFNIDTALLGQGTSSLKSLSYTLADGSEHAVDFALSTSAYVFDVTQATEPVADLTAYTIDDAGELVEAQSVEDALDVAGVSDVMLNAMAVDAASDAEGQAATKLPGLVIALDPGHDNQSPGAQGQGLREEELTLKIAQACRDELETYPGVSVYMTRDDSGDCPYFTDYDHDEAECLKRRVADAVAAGASVLVSIHINSADTSKSHGAEVWFPNYSAGITTVTQDGENLAQSIQDRLVALGLYDRGIKENDTYIDSSGNERDYYSIIRNAKKNNVPGIIVEHAFISGKDDYKFLSSDTALHDLGIADAKGIADFFGLSKDKDNSGLSLSELHVADIDGATRTVTLGGSTGLSGAAHFYVDVTFPDGTMHSLEMTKVDDTNWEGTFKLPADVVVGTLRFDGYVASAANSVLASVSTTGEVKRFNDIEADEWYLDYVAHVVDAGIMTGFSDDDGVCRTFGPEETMTRGMVATMLYRIANPSSTSTTDPSNYGMESSFPDVAIGQWYTAAIEWAYQQGIVTGYKDGEYAGLFRPDKTVSREELATMLWRYAKGCGLDVSVGSIDAFYDADQVSDFALDALAWCNAKGILTGDTTTGIALLNPKNSATRAQAAKMFDVFSGVVGSSTPDNGGGEDVPFEVTALSCRMTDEGAGYELWIPSGQVKPAGAVSIAIWKAGSDVTSAQWFIARYVEDLDLSSAGEAKGTWAVELARSQLAAGDYVAQVWAAPTADGEKEAFATVKFSTDLHPIMNSSSKVTIADMVADYKASGVTYPAEVYKDKGAATIEEFCQILYEEARDEGVDPGVVYVQAMNETGYLRFGGQVDPKQCNFSGLGATDDGAAGHTFASVREGLRAQVQHLRLYADPPMANYSSNTSLLKHPLVDPRFSSWLAGWCPYVEGLGSRWASVSSYGWVLAGMLDDLR